MKCKQSWADPFFSLVFPLFGVNVNFGSKTLKTWPFSVFLYLAFWFLLLISGLHHVSWPLYFCFGAFKIIFAWWIVIPSPLPCAGSWWWNWLLLLGFSSQLSRCFCHHLLLFFLANMFCVFFFHDILNCCILPNACAVALIHSFLLFQI